VSRILYLDPFGGAAGDMLLGALLDLGADRRSVDEALAGLGLAGWSLSAERTRHQGFAGTRVTVAVTGADQPARRRADVEALLAAAALPEPVRERSLAAFRRLFEAEAAAHGVAPAETHLHELAAVDAVVDIVGVCAAVSALDVERVVCGPVPVGSGSVETAHGLLPVPAPAVAELLRGVPLAAHAAAGEMTTPTGAVLLTTLAEEFGALPAGTLRGVGVGLGVRRHAGLPNLLRVFLIEADLPATVGGRPAVLVETTLDDVTGEALGHVLTLLRERGALDAWCLPGTGRKGRPVVELRAVCAPAAAAAVADALLGAGVTLGVRVVPCTRPEAERRVIEVTTRFGAIPVKVGTWAGRVVSVKPEHDACRAVAERLRVSLAAVVQAAVAAAPAIGSAPDDPR
jgi:uncharacterized protein (TIGR00299 family) protein